jgi:hypothetical protein
MSGITVAFVCPDENHATLQQFHKDGGHYWIDYKTKYNRIGYYFVYYIEYHDVYVYQIVNQVPHETQNLDQLHLSKLLKRFSWEEWFKEIVGTDPPYHTYTPKTGSWSWEEIQITWKTFDMTRLNDLLIPDKMKEEIKPVPINNVEGEEDIEEEEVYLVEQMNQRITRKITEKIKDFRQEYMLLMDKKIEEIEASIESLKLELEAKRKEKENIFNGVRDHEIIKHETTIKVQQFIMEYL